MPITKAAGNMYDWITHTHSHLRGACPHACQYCYVQAIGRRFNSPHHQGPVRIAEKELAENYSSPRVLREAREMGHDNPIIFIEHANDLYARGVPDALIEAILAHMRSCPDIDFILQTKNPVRVDDFIVKGLMPRRYILGTTAETDDPPPGLYGPDARCPVPERRLDNLADLQRRRGIRTFVTVEPVLRMHDPSAFADRIASCRPEFVNIGADSKRSSLPEPDPEDVMILISRLTLVYGIIVNLKPNLHRILTSPNHATENTP